MTVRSLRHVGLRWDVLRWAVTGTHEVRTDALSPCTTGRCVAGSHLHSDLQVRHFGAGGGTRWYAGLPHC
jgi:hypothetical protein